MSTLGLFAVAGVLLLAVLVGLIRAGGRRTIALIAAVLGAVAATSTLTPWQETGWYTEGSMSSSGTRWDALGIESPHFPGLYVLALCATGTVVMGLVASLDDRRLGMIRRRMPLAAAIAMAAASVLTLVSLGPTRSYNESTYYSTSTPAFGIALTATASALAAAAAVGVALRKPKITQSRREGEISSQASDAGARG